MVVPVEGGIVRRLGWGAVLDVLPDDDANILIQTAGIGSLKPTK